MIMFFSFIKICFVYYLYLIFAWYENLFEIFFLKKIKLRYMKFIAN